MKFLSYDGLLARIVRYIWNLLDCRRRFPFGSTVSMYNRILSDTEKPSLPDWL